MNTSSGRDVPVDITLWDAVWRIFGVCISPVGSLSLCAYDLLVAWKFTAVACLVSVVLFLQFFSWLIQTQGLMKTAVWGAGMTWYKSTGEALKNFLNQFHVLWKGLYDTCAKKEGDIGIKFIVWDVCCLTVLYFLFFLIGLAMTITVLSLATLCSCFYRHKAEDNPQVPEPPPAHQDIPIPAGLNPAYVGAFRQFIGRPAAQSQPPPPSAPAAPGPAMMQPQVDMNALVLAALMAEFAKRQENTLNSGEAPQTTGNDKKRARDGAEGEAGVENRKRTRQELEDSLEVLMREAEALKAELTASQDASGEDMTLDDPPAAPTAGKGIKRRQA
jgi:hypothetical protein